MTKNVPISAANVAPSAVWLSGAWSWLQIKSRSCRLVIDACDPECSAVSLLPPPAEGCQHTRDREQIYLQWIEVSSGLRVVCKKVYCHLECTLNKISLSSWVAPLAQAPRSLTMAVNIASCQHFYWHNCNAVFSYPREVERVGYCRKLSPSNSKGFFHNKKCTFPSRQTVFKWKEVQSRRQKGDPDLKICSSF